MKFLVTGGAGFIGSHTCELLVEEGHSVIALDNLETGRLSNLDSISAAQNFEFLEQDILSVDIEDNIFRGVTHIIHFAGIGEIIPSVENPLDYVDVNCKGTARILEIARNNRVESFVYAASSSCYGISQGLTSEDSKIDPKHPYALSKYMGEILVLHWHQLFGLPAKSLRIFNAYGRRVRTTGTYGAVLGVFLKQKLSGEPLTIVGNGEQKRDFVHVKDVAKAFKLASFSTKVGRIWNLGSGEPQTVNQLANLISDKKVNIPERFGEPNDIYADNSLIKADLNWSPDVKFEDGIQEILNHINEWADSPLWTPSSIASATRTWHSLFPRSEG
jgi:UDP-glucose 4-epimerase